MKIVDTMPDCKYKKPFVVLYKEKSEVNCLRLRWFGHILHYDDTEGGWWQADPDDIIMMEYKNPKYILSY